MPAMTLTPKQEAFVLAYLETGNASEAYRRVYNAAKMAPATINRKAAELLANGKIAARIAELQKRVADKAVISRAWVLERLMHNARIAMGEERIKVRIRPKSAPDTVVELEITDRNADAANRALQLLGTLEEVAMFGRSTKDEPTPAPAAEAAVPRETGQDHLAALSRRYAGGLRVIEGGSPATEKAHVRRIERE